MENLNALKFLRPVFGPTRLSEIMPEAIEDYIEQRLDSGMRIHTKFGVQHRGKLKPATVHQEFRILRRILNVAVKQKRLTVNPCMAVEFPVSVSKTTRKPHYMTASEQARIEFAAPNYLRHAIVILCEMGLRPYKELMPMVKPQVDLENGVVHIPDSKTPNGIGDMPMTQLAREAFTAQMAETPGSEYLFPSPKPKAKKRILPICVRCGPPLCAVLAFRIFQFTSCATRSPRGLAPEAWRITSLRKCFGKAIPAFSSGIAKPS